MTRPEPTPAEVQREDASIRALLETSAGLAGVLALLASPFADGVVFARAWEAFVMPHRIAAVPWGAFTVLIIGLRILDRWRTPAGEEPTPLQTAGRATGHYLGLGLILLACWLDGPG